MQIITDIEKINMSGSSAVAIGKFDGVHRGHLELLHRIVAQKEKGMESVVFTFDPAPAVFFGHADGKELTLEEEKIELFRQTGVDVLIKFPMNRQTAAIPAVSFVQNILLEKLKTGYICAGTDLSFGDKGKGNSDLLVSLSEKYGYETEIIKKIMYQGREISSSYVREEVEKGNMPVVTKLLGRNYRVEGTVVTGNQLGRTLGMPTVNLIPPTGKILPPCGVYYASVKEGTDCYQGLTNIGYKPTVSQEHILGVETYLYGFKDDLYGRSIQVELLEYKRPEMKFAGIEMLKTQMERDIAEGAAYFQLDR